MKKIITFIMLALLPMIANAYDAEIDGIYYNFSGDEAEVTNGSQKYMGDIVIPSSVTYDGEIYSVTGIGNDAFSFCGDLTSVTIPNSVVSIGMRAFRACSNLSLVTLGNGLTNFGHHAFWDCSALCSILIPNSVTSIGSCIFSGCSSLITVNIGSSVRSIDSSAFRDCSSLASIKVDEGNTYYNSQNDCNAIIETATNTLIVGCQNTVIPDGVTCIGPEAFYGRTGLTSITIPGNVTTIEEYAFQDCSGLTSITIPEGVTSIGYAAFRDCESLTSVVLPESLTSLGGDAFCRCYALEHINIPDGLTVIGNDAFYGTLWLNNLPDGLIYFGRICYRYKGEMPEGTEIELKEGTMEIAGGAFAGCTGLVSVVISESVTTIGESAFAGCTGLTSINIPNGVTTIGDEAFRYCVSLASITIPESVTDIGYRAFEGCYFTKGSFIDNSSSYFGGWYDYGAVLCDEETSDGLMILENFVVGCRLWATAVTIPENVIGIGDEAFHGHSNLTSVVIGSGVTSIGESAFEGCYNLSDITISENVTSVGGDAFGGTAWLDNQPDGLIYVGKVAYEYKGEMPEGTEIVLKEGTVGIAAFAFFNCSGLTSVTIPESVTNIGGWAFESTGLTSISVPGSVTCIESSTFCDCADLTSAIIGNGVTSIGYYVFDDCLSLTSVILPSSLTEIKYQAFENCISLKEIYCYAEETPEVDEDAFQGVNTSSVTLYVPGAAVDAYKTTEPWSGFGKILSLETEKCATPTISYANGKLTFYCEMEDVKYITSITDDDIKTYETDEIDLSVTYTISVYATKEGYLRSDVATATLCWIDAEPRTEGLQEDAVAEVKALPILIQSQGGIITIQGVDSGIEVFVYSTDGKKEGSAISVGNQVVINTNLASGSIAIVKIGEKSIKVKIM